MPANHIVTSAHRWVRRALCVLLAALAFTAQADDYTPLFSQKILSGLDAETRERFQALENENYRRWRNRNPQARDVAAAKRSHEETEAMLRRFEESRRLQQLAQHREQSMTAEQRKKCEIVAAEIKELSEGGLFYETAADGQRRYLSDKEVSARVNAQQKSYNKHCKG